MGRNFVIATLKFHFNEFEKNGGITEELNLEEEIQREEKSANEEIKIQFVFRKMKSPSLLYLTDAVRS